MRNPLENEEAAFRFVLATIAYLAPIVVASWIATWLGVVVFVVATAVVVIRSRRRTQARAVAAPGGRAAVEDTWRILVIANETLGGTRLREVIVRLAEGVAEDVLVVCPLDPAGAPAAGPADERARAAADARLSEAVGALRTAGVEVRGEIADGDAVAALQAALAGFAADEIVISTHAAERFPLLEEGVVTAAGGRFDGPVTYVTGDPPDDGEGAAPGS
jgi:hypothetical protein